MNEGCVKLSCRVPEAALEAFEDVLQDFGFAARLVPIRNGRDWDVEAYGPAATDANGLRAILAEAVDRGGQTPLAIDLVWLPQRDWLAENQTSFAPLRIGRFYVHDSGHRGQSPASSWPIWVDAATAFGTGSHQTTRACLLSIERLARHGRRHWPQLVLDMGCGSGILSIAAVKSMRCRVVACDVDAEAVRVARANCRRNSVSRLVDVRLLSGNNAKPAAATYDLIVANILADPLIKLAPYLAPSLRPGGRLVLAGMLEHQGRAVLNTYLGHGLRLVSREVSDDWISMIVGRGREEGRSSQAASRHRSSLATARRANS